MHSATHRTHFEIWKVLFLVFIDYAKFLCFEASQDIFRKFEIEINDQKTGVNDKIDSLWHFVC